MIELIVSDLDDTLLDRSGDISPRTMRALHAAMQAGARVTFATGRMLEATSFFAAEIGIDTPLITYNGAMVYDFNAQRTISLSSIDTELAKEICLAGEKMGVYMQFYPGKSYYCQEATGYTKAYADSIRIRARTTPDGMPLSKWISDDAVKLLCIGEKEDMPQVLARFREAFPNDVHFFMSRPAYIEVISANSNKHTALKSLARSIEVEAENILAFGDGENDIGMLEYAGHGYAVANAGEQVRARAKHTTASNADDGVAQVIEQLLAEGKIGRR